MLLDLNDYDRLKELNKLNEKQIVQLNDKVFFLEKSISQKPQALVQALPITKNVAVFFV